MPLLEQAVEQVAAGSHSRSRCCSASPGWARRICWPAARTTRCDSPSARSRSPAQHKERGDEAWALRLLGEIAAHADPPDVEQAESHYRQALALADELGMRPLVAHCHLGLGTLYRKIGRDEQAQAELATAAEMYRAMEMTVLAGEGGGATGTGRQLTEPC